MKSLPYILLVCALFFGCKKYPEDKTLVHFRTVKNRIEHFSPWYIKEYTVDGADSLNHLNTKFWWAAPVEEIPWSINSGYHFDDKKNKVMFNTYKFHIPNHYPNYWDIVRLDKDKFIMRMNFNSKEYKLVLGN
ncbi:MAG: hypothetical protein IPG89_11615 [Bacteroidetes bacterium]|nr:hypothetical protein [Bacteroidota bacterium]